MAAALSRIVERIDAMAERERLLLAATVAVLLVVLAFVGYIEPTMKQRAQDQDALEQTRTQLAEAQTQIQALQTRLAQDPDALARARHQALETELAEVDATLAREMGQVITPEQMARLLQDLLESNKRLTLTRITSEPATPLTTLMGPEGEVPDAEDAKIPALYRHGLRIEFSGDYLSALDYLRTLEELPWRLFWDRIDLQTEDYPTTSIRLRVYTLSLSEGWIGV
jgi:MSHA biogenesis protein MshJ